MLLTRATLATLNGDTPYGLVSDGAVWTRAGRIAWAGQMNDIPEAAWSDDTLDLDGRLITPGLVDCHTHIVHGGNRAHEFEMRLQGASYEAIAQAGGGIAATVSATRSESEDALLASALARVDQLVAEGMTTIEIKSGYGLDVETELKMLRVARKIDTARTVRVRTSFLGAHAVPPDYANRHDAYLDEVCLPALGAAHGEGLVDAVDGFCEGIAFSPEQIRKVFDKARSLGLPLKLHAEQLSWLGGTELAAAYGALSCDHLEYATSADAASMAKAGTVAVLLPGAYYFLRETKLPPLDALRCQGVPLALATDCNPGSSPLTSLLLTMNMGCTLFGMTPEETLAGVTVNGARALGLSDVGQIRPGYRADLAVWNVERPAELAYRVGFNPLHLRMFEGEIA
ncbi:MAG TPA: imidazolonepropionase [Hyphomonas sp.]|nr:imidazolonepropionase [Hyphomonas sp.]HRK67557.1 imidazolonepropionase [Hyphomonas sp.]